MNEQNQPRYISLDDAAKELGVNKNTLYYYTKQLAVEMKKFPLDRRAYITLEDFGRIRDAKRAAIERKH